MADKVAFHLRKGRTAKVVTLGDGTEYDTSKHLRDGVVRTDNPLEIEALSALGSYEEGGKPRPVSGENTKPTRSRPAESTPPVGQTVPAGTEKTGGSN